MTPGDTQARSRFQNGLLTWLRAAAPHEHANGLREMIAVTRELAGVDDGSTGLLWRSAASFLQALLEGSLSADDESRALCRRLERHLSTLPNPRVPHGENKAADALANAIFAYVSNRLPELAGGSPIGTASSAPESFLAPPFSPGNDPALNALLNNTLAATADVLPLLGNAQTRRFSDAQVAEWHTAIARLRTDWHAVQTGAQTDCRAASIALLQLSLSLADPPCLCLAEAFAEASGAAEDPALLALPGFRAAFSAALELAEHPDGPEQKSFADNASFLGSRLLSSVQAPKPGAGLVCASAPWFAEDALEVLEELATALDAVPPRRLELLSGFDWFVQHESGKVMAIRGLATTAHRVIGQIRTDDLDEPDTHTIIGRTIAALRTAVSTLADGQPPLADESVFSDLRELDARVAAQRKAAIAAAKAASS